MSLIFKYLLKLIGFKTFKLASKCPPQRLPVCGTPPFKVIQFRPLAGLKKDILPAAGLQNEGLGCSVAARHQKGMVVAGEGAENKSRAGQPVDVSVPAV